ncbi:hypothetical protein H6F43_01745 [Leptolyngbya sp. FACHB-36]|uniref:hypothetical protein n=1 Tax=Leptolyngbya sp. FACHB-36 TaxID=2692808 RepID=UPI001681325E|nr:hypothetical protein [Leptolyngbya sp. FACHB-36]MBD2018908.1 hypothetical protein [Leptolyngbya sp. FACHB-36]
MSSSEPPSDFEQHFTEVERSLQDLKLRYSQVQHDQQRQAALQQRQAQIQQADPKEQASHSAELQRIQDQLDELEVNLESRLFRWDSLKEPFWQVVRFGGLGIVIGWFLATAAIQTPKPASPPAVAPRSLQP